jgi:Uncharacterized protein conserved in bacteria (DUF2188)
MSKPNAREVRPDPTGGWKVINPGGQRASGHFDRQSDAVTRAREILQGWRRRIAGRRP